MLNINTVTAIDRYERIRHLNAGGMAEVYLARHRGPGGFDKLCVVKRMRPELRSRPHSVDMFLDEARLAALFRHENLPQVFEVGLDADGLPFYAMEYLEGADCRQLNAAAWRSGRGIPLGNLTKIITEAAVALAYAHAACGSDGRPLRVVHRDISPSNIYVTITGGVKVVDFGVAQSEVQSLETAEGVLKGKLPYMSPEQICGATVDHRSDIFSLGCVLYELSVGDRPFDGTCEFQTMQRIASGHYDRPTAVVPDYPPALARIVETALQRSPEQRFPSANAMADALEAFSRTIESRVTERSLGAWVRSFDESSVVRAPRGECASSVPQLDISVGADPGGTARVQCELTTEVELACPPDLPTEADTAIDSPRDRRLRGRAAMTSLAIALVVTVAAFVAWSRPSELSAAVNHVPQPPANIVAPVVGVEAPAANQRERSTPAKASGVTQATTDRRHVRLGGTSVTERATRGKPRPRSRQRSRAIRRPRAPKRNVATRTVRQAPRRGHAWRTDSPFPPVR